MSQPELVGHLTQIVILQIQRAQMFHAADARSVYAPDLVAVDKQVLQNWQLIDALGKFGETILGQVELA